MLDDRLLVDWKTLKKLGWPFSRSHTWRMIEAGDFPPPIKPCKHRSGRVFWYWKDVEEQLRKYQVDTVTAMCTF